MERLRNALEILDTAISDLEDRVGLALGSQRDEAKKTSESLKDSRAREANVMAAAQKVASRLDRAIEHVESILRH